ncbi:MAG: hypothetical protein M3Z74_04510 [Pseudomonadota bacterium]|nr:hypothetical protein [Pseudomonadota bacterium]
MPLAASADDNPLGMSYVETKDLKLIYFDPLGYLVPHAVRTFTNSLAWQRRMFDWTPSEPTTVALKDFADYGNARAIPAPHNTLVFDVAPNSRAFETYPGSERMYSFMNHEMVHIATNDVSNPEDNRWRRFFLGKVAPRTQNPETLLYSFLTVPRYTAPRWYLEGAAVFMETWMDGGIGRAQGGYDEMVFRAMVRDDAHFYDPLGLVSRGVQVDFQIGANAYLYGTRFFTWLAYTYSPENVVAWLKRNEGSERYYSDGFQQVFGLSLERAWQDWIAFEHEFQQRNLAELRRYPITPYRKLAGSAMGSISRMYYDEKSGMLYAAFRYPGFVEHVGAMNTRDGSERPLADIIGAKLYKVASFAYDPASGIAFFTNDNAAFRDLMAVDVRTGEQQMLLKDARIGEIAFNPVDRSLMGVRHVNGLTQFVRIPYPYSEWQLVYSFSYGSVPYDLDISPDGRLLSASMSEVNTDEFVRVWELDKVLRGDLKPLSEFRFGQSTPESFVFSRDGRYLYGSSYYTGVSNIFRYEVATGEVEAVSNAEIGFFRPVPLADGRLVVFAYTGEGFLPAIIEPHPLKDVSAVTFFGAELAEKYPIVKTWQVPPPSTADYEKQVIREGPYLPARHLGVDNAYPVLQGYKNSIGIGYHTNIADPIAFLNLGMTAAYTPTGNLPGGERGHVELSAQYLGWHGSLSWNRSNFYDLFGPTKRSRKGYAAKFGYDDLLIYEDPRKLTLSYDLEYYDKLDTLPNAQNVQTNFTRLATGKIGLHYSDVRRSLGAVDDEKGLTWNVELDANRVSGQFIPQLYGNLDLGFALPLAHSSVWLRSAAGIASGDRNNPVANFYFGGFGNNYVDDGKVKRYREYSSLPGFRIDDVSALSFVREMVEWNLPPVVFESVGTPSFYLNWLRPAVFAAGLWTDPGHTALRKNYSSVGSQADLHFSVLHWYDMTLSVGYAIGHQGSRRADTEWMISLKIM